MASVLVELICCFVVLIFRINNEPQNHESELVGCTSLSFDVKKTGLKKELKCLLDCNSATPYDLGTSGRNAEGADRLPCNYDGFQHSNVFMTTSEVCV